MTEPGAGTAAQAEYPPCRCGPENEFNQGPEGHTVPVNWTWPLTQRKVELLVGVAFEKGRVPIKTIGIRVWQRCEKCAGWSPVWDRPSEHHEPNPPENYATFPAFVASQVLEAFGKAVADYQHWEEDRKKFIAESEARRNREEAGKT